MGPLVAHSECLLRDSLGGIGHLIDHEHFCGYLGDPDASLSKRLSALLVDTYVSHVGVNAAVEHSLNETELVSIRRV